MQEIINLCEYIWAIYCGLEFLELDGINNDEDIYELKKCLVLEWKLIDELIKEYEYDYDKIMDIVLNNKDIVDDSVRKRIYDSITLYKLLYDERIIFNSFSYRLNKLYSSCFRNMYLMYFSFLQEIIDDEKDNNRKELLVRLKYYDAFFNHDMESVLILYNFNIPIFNYVDLDIAGQLADLDNGIDEVVVNYIDIILGLVFEILDIKDVDYNDSSQFICLVKNQCMFRACLSLISEEDYMIISDEIKKIMDSKINVENKNSVKLINSIINMRNKDRERVRRLSLRNL